MELSSKMAESQLTPTSSKRIVFSTVLLAAEALLESDIEESKDFLNNDIPIPLIASLLSFSEKFKSGPKDGIFGDKERNIQDYSTEDFRTHFRISKQTYLLLCEKLQNCPNIMPSNSHGGRPPVPVEKQVQLTLWILQNPEPVHSVAARFNVSQSTVVRITKKICELILQHLYHEYVVWPTGVEQEQVMINFQNLAGLPGVTGVLNTTHILIKAHLEEPQKYRNSNGQHSLILQAVCRDDLRFIDCVCCSPGRLPNTQALLESPLYQRANELCGNFHLVADPSYPLLPWLMTPYENNGFLTQEQVQFNNAINATRIVVDKAFGALQGRFRRLRFVDMRGIGDISKMILAACVIHNMCIANGENPLEFLDETTRSPPAEEIQTILDNDVNGSYKRDSLTRELMSQNYPAHGNLGFGFH